MFVFSNAISHKENVCFKRVNFSNRICYYWNIPVSGTDRKREGVSAPIIPSKKTKLSSSGLSSSSSTSRSSGSISNADAWETLALDVDPADFVLQVLEASDADEADKVVSQLVKIKKIINCIFLGVVFMNPYLLVSKQLLKSLFISSCQIFKC